MKKVFHKSYKDFETEIDGFIESFGTSGESIKDKRNKLKLFNLNDVVVNIKSFKVPNLLNKIGYNFFRKSKAQRSFEYANKLLELGIGSPQPIAFYEFPSVFFFKSSYYVSEHQKYDLTFRELSHNADYPNHENLLRAFTRFTHELHEKEVLFLDHSPGNTLISITSDGYDFSLVDLNRMIFKPLSFNERIKNFERLTPHKHIVEIMSDEYAKISGKSFDHVFTQMWKATQEFQYKFNRKKRLKNKLKFWKN
ncbi:MAG: Kdo domain containing protein [Algibacter sp.]|uniref:Kdo domain containing protein n=1 Tax=Algibacter sp. TaxID=1872428 RepID=UPI00261F7363|nr:Kdo domain containing protein [Algibacter sp.]MDG1728400.1 Kdo domain containing protein [Algibacter sp.]MDG2179275.1 Kdo domain containing protein [Algibacter sp.]